MTSRESLVGLATHLQAMEDALVDFILEAALRLFSITDAGVLVVVENQRGRRFCGKGALVRRFLDNGLSLDAGDVEVELNEAVAPLKIKKAPNFDAASAPKRRRLESKAPVVDVKPEVEELVIDDDENEDATESFGGGASAGGAGGGGDYLWMNDGYSGQLFNSQLDENSFPAENVFDRLDSLDSSAPDVEGMTSDSRRRLKERAVRDIRHPAAAFRRGTTESKLLASILYDFGKETTLANPHPLESAEAKRYFAERLDNYVRSFPQFATLTTTPDMTALFARDGALQQYTPLSFMKMNARNGYKRVFRTRRKAVDPHS